MLLFPQVPFSAKHWFKMLTTSFIYLDLYMWIVLYNSDHMFSKGFKCRVCVDLRNIFNSIQFYFYSTFISGHCHKTALQKYINSRYFSVGLG